MSEQEITKEMTIGEVVTKHPVTEKVFTKFFGAGCFTCPGSKMENIAFGSSMHGIEPDIVVKELNDAINASE